MSALRWIALLLATRTAAADDRVVLADPDPELRHAIEGTLRPWRIAVVVEPAPATADDARARAGAAGVRFVVWRDRDELVVFDRETNTSERRPARAGTFDPVGAAAAALSIKTMLRLPPLDAPGPAVAVELAGPTFRVQLGGSLRLAHGSDLVTGGRASVAGAIAPWGGALRFGLAADLGPAATVDNAGFKGTWSDWTALGFASRTIGWDSWELEPALGVGVERSALRGTEQNTPREELATLLVVRAGATARYRFGRFTAGGELAASVAPGAPTYMKVQGMAEVFGPASFAISLGIVVSADLGR